MRKNFTFMMLTAAALAMSVQTTAQTVGSLSSRAKKTAAELTLVNGNMLQETTKGRFNAAASSTPIRVTKAPTDYGEEVVIMTEDFSKFATGTPESPDLKTNINFQNDDNAWINMKNEYTETPGWGSHEVFCAGGMAYLKSSERDQAQMNTPMLDLSGNQGIAFIQFKARAVNEGDKPMMILEAAETYNMAPTWKFLENAETTNFTTEWQTYELMVYNAEEYTFFNIVTMNAPVLIDDVKVFQIKADVQTPVGLGHKKYKGTSFDISWTEVQGADSYLLNVYRADASTGNITEYLVENKEVDGTSYSVTGAIDGETYYYTVSAVKDGKQSFVSKPVEVTDIATPVLDLPGEIADGKYSASWTTVGKAERYNYLSYYERTADADGEFVITDENFDGIRESDGTLSGLTLENPDSYTYDEAELKELNQAGWTGKNYRPYTDYICLDGYHYIYNHSDAGLISPELDLSKDNGKVDMTVKLYGTVAEIWDENNVKWEYQTGCAVALFNWNEELEDFEQAELVYADGVEPAWNTFGIQLTKGSKRSIIGLYAVSAPENLYIDDLRITQNYKEGETFLDPFFFSRFAEETNLEVTIPWKANECPMYHTVQAVRNNGQMKSLWADKELVGKGPASGVSNPSVSMANATVRMEGGKLVVNNPEGAAVAVYDLSGRTVMTDNSGRTSLKADMPAHGTYIVKVGKRSVKLTF